MRPIGLRVVAFANIGAGASIAPEPEAAGGSGELEQVDVRRLKPGSERGGSVKRRRHRDQLRARYRSRSRRTSAIQAINSSRAASASAQVVSMKRIREPMGAWPRRQRSASMTVPIFGYPPDGWASHIWTIGWPP